MAESINVTDAQLRTAYSANMDSFRMPERTHVQHILVMTQGKLEGLGEGERRHRGKMRVRERRGEIEDEMRGEIRARRCYLVFTFLAFLLAKHRAE